MRGTKVVEGRDGGGDEATENSLIWGREKQKQPALVASYPTFQ